ncbi:MAG TPA: PEP-CTERM sorting domain-containing protein [Steroidobacteraceae bacterium]
MTDGPSQTYARASAMVYRMRITRNETRSSASTWKCRSSLHRCISVVRTARDDDITRQSANCVTNLRRTIGKQHKQILAFGVISGPERLAAEGYVACATRAVPEVFAGIGATYYVVSISNCFCEFFQPWHDTCFQSGRDRRIQELHMLKYARIALLPIVAALTLVMAPAEAISIGSGTSATSAQTAPATSQQPTKKQLKQQRKLAKKCAKLRAGKIKKASKRAKYEKLCAQPTGSTPPAQGQGSAPDLDEGQDTSTPTSGGSDGDGPDTNGGSTGNGNAGGGSSQAGGGYLDEILDSPPIFTPPPGGSGDDSSDDTQVPTVDALVPTNAVPEPGSLALLGLGLAGLGLAGTRRRKN